MGLKRQTSPLKLFCRISRLEHTILCFLGGPGGMAKAVRRMVFHYVRTSPEFDHKAFEAFAREQVMPDLGDSGRKDLELDLKFLRDKLEVSDGEVRGPLVDAKALTGFLAKTKD